MKKPLQETSPQLEREARLRMLQEKENYSPRAAMAFSGLSTATWLRETLRGLYERIVLGRSKTEKDAEPRIHILKSTVHLVAALLMLTLLAVGARAWAGLSTVETATNKDEQTLRDLNVKLLTANDKADAATLDQIEADDFTLSGDFGTMSKQQHLEHVRKATPIAETVNRQITPQNIRFYGDVALVTETDHASGSGGSSEYQTTSMWVRNGGNWRIVHMHYSKLSEK